MKLLYIKTVQSSSLFPEKLFQRQNRRCSLKNFAKKIMFVLIFGDACAIISVIMISEKVNLNFKEVYKSANSAVFSRARGYANADCIQNYKCYETVIDARQVWIVNAEIEGSSTYDTSIIFDEGGYPIEMDCDCPYEGSGICKHVAALALYGERLRQTAENNDVEVVLPAASSAENVKSGGIVLGNQTFHSRQELVAHLCKTFSAEAAEKFAEKLTGTRAAAFSSALSSALSASAPTPRPRPEPEHRLVNEYARQTNLRAIGAAQEKVKLVPFLKDCRAYDTRITMSVKIGYDRLYSVRNLSNLSLEVRNGYEHSYGKDFSAIHSESMFAPEYAAFASTLLRYVDAKRQESRGYYYGGNVSFGSEVKLEWDAIDIFFPILLKMQQEDPVYQNNNSIYLIDGNPELKIDFSRDKDGAYILSENFNGSKIIRGISHDYAVVGNKLYRLAPGYADTAEPLFSAQRGDKNFTENQFRTFFQKAAPEISAHFNVQYKGIDLAQFTPEKFDCKFYLDRVEGVITARVDAGYGASRIELGSGNYQRYESAADIRAELGIRNLLRKYFEYDWMLRTFAINGDDKEFFFLTEGIAEFERAGEVFVTDAFKAIRVNKKPDLSLGVRLENNLLEIDMKLSDEYSDRDVAAILSAYRLKKKYVRLRGDAFLQLGQDGQLAAAIELLDAAGIGSKGDVPTGKIILPKFRAMHVDGLAARYGLRAERDAAFGDLINNVTRFEAADIEPPTGIASALRPYQKSGFKWMKTLGAYGFGGILADDMGLGKSIQAISFIGSLPAGCGPALIICPSSLVLNWRNEFAKFSPATRVLCINGTKDERQAKIRSIAGKCDFDVVVTSYELLRKDVEQYARLRFECCIIDEAQYIKNHGTKNAKAVKAINAVHRFALSGTPIENSLAELWSVFDFIMPGYLYTYGKFSETFERKIVKQSDKAATERLNAMSAPFILRRLKKEVLKELPEKLESVFEVELEDKQKDVYAAHALMYKNKIESLADDSRGKIEILALLMRLRQLCCDPSLFLENYNGNSAKLDAALDLIRSGVENGHKILLFSQFTSMLAIIGRSLEREGIKYFLLQGDTKTETRVDLVEEFNSCSDTRVFLISLKAGGTGLNLTSADIVIHYDPWWNLSVETQATDRAHRIGQKNTVQVYKLILKNTIEEKIVALQNRKKQLFDSVIREGETDITKMSKAEILSLLE